MIITYGRSGSTLLQTAMNEFDNVCIRGENYLAAAPLYESWRRIVAAKSEQGAEYSKPGQPWYGANEIDEEEYGRDLADSFIKNILKPSSNTEWIGFKEIRYNNLGDSFEEFMNFSFRFFPNLRVIFNLREWDAVCSSGWFAKDNPEEVRKMLASTEKRFAEVALLYPDRTMTVQYEKMISDPEEYRKIADFLDVPYDAEKIANVLSKKLSH